jgi:hypothetical protein
MILDFNSAKRLDQVEAERRSVDAADIRARLHANPRGFVEWLFGGRAYCNTTEARIGDVEGTPGASLAVALSGAEAGLWRDHATNEGGDLIRLYQAYRGYREREDFQLALQEIASEFFGDPVRVERAPWQPSASAFIEEKRQKLGSKPREDMQLLGAPVATYRYTDLQGNQVASVVRYEPDGTRESKTFRPYCFHEENGRRVWKAGAPLRHRPLYRLAQIALASHLVLVEGEGKAEALAALGIAATSAMQGAKAPLELTDWAPIRGKNVTIWPDNDEPGHDYAAALAAHLGTLGCSVRIVQVSDKPPKWDAGDCVAESGDVHGLLAAAVLFATPVSSRIRILDISEFKNEKPPRFLVEKLLPANGFSMWWGRSGALKSFVVLDVGLCVSQGRAWHGLTVEPGLVLYIAAEGAYGLIKRALGWLQNKGEGKRARFKLIPQALMLTKDVTELVEALKQLGEMPVLIIVDTLARTFTGNENHQEDMNAYVAAIDTLRQATNAHVAVVHHAGKNDDKGERGSSVLRAAADAVIHIKRSSPSTVEIINIPPLGKQKDAEECETIRLRVQTVEVEFEEGQRESTLVLIMDDDPLPPQGSGGRGGREDRLTQNEERFLALLREFQPRGFTTLVAVPGGVSKARYAETVASLCEKNLIKPAPDSSEKAPKWILAIQP